MSIARDEVFGPVLAVLTYDTVEEAIAIANDTDYGLSAGVWGTDETTALDVARRLEAGMVYVNDWHVINPTYPFGGYKQSGLGREGGPDALDEYTEQKYISIDRSGGVENRGVRARRRESRLDPLRRCRNEWRPDLVRRERCPCAACHGR